MIDPNKKYQTRDGREVTLLYRVPHGFPTEYPWRGVVAGVECLWLENGRYLDGMRHHPKDLIEVPTRPREWWVTRYLGGPDIMHSSKDEAEEYSIKYETELIHVREVLPNQPSTP